VKPTAQADRILLEHMLDCAARVREYTQSDRATFFGSPLVQDAVMRNLQVMAESSQRLSEAIKAAESSVSWVRIAGMRNILVHQYLGGIDLETVWGVIERELAPFEDALRRIHARLGAD
jgi:uncharacterized protein with HEPN domain